MTFKSLLPKDLDEELKPYEQAFDTAINSKKEKIANIAVTGNYGAGKSSVISSFLNNERWFFKWKLPKWKIFNGKIFKRDRAITISLATFELNGYEVDQSNQKIQNIEFSILQQLIHKAHPNKLPKSRFERIINRHSKQNYLSAFVGVFSIGLLTLSLLLMFGWKPLVGKLDFTDIYNGHSFIIAPIILILIIFYYLACYIVQAGLFNKQDIQSFDLLKGQATFKNKREQSVLNLFLDEILYFFEVTKYDVIVFEDLDRHEHKEIFIRLREINQLINTSGQGKRPIKFIYAVKDDLFTDQESRVKFFDFIIPIIPVMDLDNSYSLLKEELLRHKSKEKLIHSLERNSNLLSDISLYINDMRLMINIVNEYFIYLEKEDVKKLEDGEERDNKLQYIFALMAYKNLMPEDYGKIKNRESILCKITKDYLNQESELYESFRNVRNELESANKALEEAYQYGHSHVPSCEDNHFIAEVKVQKISKHLSLKETLELIVEFEDSEWQKRYLNADNKTDAQIIFMLIQEGYLDESYSYYVAVSQHIDPEVNNFKRALLSRISFKNAFNIRLAPLPIKSFLEEIELGEKDYSTYPNILNFDLMCYLLLNIDNSHNRIFFEKIIFNHFHENKKFHIDFLCFFIETFEERKYQEKIIVTLIKSIFETMHGNGHVDILQKFVSEITIITHEDGDPEREYRYVNNSRKIALTYFLSIISPNIFNWGYRKSIIETFAKRYLLSDKIFILSSDFYIENIIEWLRFLDVEVSLDYKIENFAKNKMVSKIIENSLYKINDKNIKRIFEFKNYSTEELIGKPYTKLCEYFDKSTFVRKNIEQNISVYVDRVLLDKDNATLESNEAIIRLINNQSLSNAQKIELIQKQKLLIFDNDFIQIDKTILISNKDETQEESSFVASLVKLDLDYRNAGNSNFIINATWENAYHLLVDNNALPEELRNKWLDYNYAAISKTALLDEYKIPLKMHILLNTGLDENAYHTLVSTLKVKPTSEELENLGWYEIQSLLKLHFIVYSPNVIKHLYIKHILKNDSSYYDSTRIKTLFGYVVDNCIDDLLGFLLDDGIDDNHKKEIVSLLSDENLDLIKEYLNEERLALSLKENLIREVNFHLDDLSSIPENFHQLLMIYKRI